MEMSLGCQDMGMLIHIRKVLKEDDNHVVTSDIEL